MRKTDAQHLPITLFSFLDLIKTDPSSLYNLLSHKKKYYSSFPQKKKKGGLREITPSRGPLKILQYKIKSLIDAHIEWPVYLHGGIKDRSVLTNARHHVGRSMVVNLDIKECFPNTTKEKVIETMKQLGLESSLANLFADICTFQGHIPQGAPTSTAIVNLVLMAIDKNFCSYCRKRGFNYSRFVDDITISADCDLRPFKNIFHNFIESNGYRVSQYLALGRDKQQVVTGLIVNDKLRPTSTFIRKLKDDIKAGWKDRGAVEAVANDYGFSISQLKKNIWGRVNFIKSIDKRLGREIRGLLVRGEWNQKQ